MSRLQQGISKLNNLNHHSGGSSLSRLSTPSTVGGGGGGKNFEELKRQIHGKLVERLDFTRVKDLSSDAMRRDIPAGDRAPVRHREPTPPTGSSGRS